MQINVNTAKATIKAKIQIKLKINWENTILKTDLAKTIIPKQKQIKP